MLRKHLNRSSTAKRLNPCHHLIQNDTERVQVATFIPGITSCLFRRSIKRRAKLACCKGVCRYSQQFGQSKISQNRLSHAIACRIMLIQQNIRWLDITMNHSQTMRVVHGKADGCKKIDNLGRRWNFPLRGRLADIISQRPTLDIRHHHIGKRSVRLGRP